MISLPRRPYTDWRDSNIGSNHTHIYQTQRDLDYFIGKRMQGTRYFLIFTGKIKGFSAVDIKSLKFSIN